MRRIFIRTLLFSFTYLIFSIAPSHAQTLTISNTFTGTYTPGSSIGVLFTIDNTSGCIQQSNQFNLILSDASGNFAPGTVIGTATGTYATYINGVIPVGTPAGTGYKVMIKSTAPAVSSAPSSAFTITAGTVVTAGINGVNLNGDPHIFGACNGTPNTVYDFIDNSSTGSSTATIKNETTGAITPITFAPNGAFTANTTNYTILVTATDGTTIGTQAYSLINNIVKNSFAVSSTTTVCLTTGGGQLTYFVDTSSPNGIQNNYPGIIYQVTWGDGTTSNYSLCDLIASAGQITHTYFTGSCGQPNNAFEVDMQPTASYCPSLISPIKSEATVLRVPTNSFTFVTPGCTNAPITFINTSDPGQDPSSNVNNCINPNATYTWSIDGVPFIFNAPLSFSFTHTFTTNGPHTITLHLNNNTAGLCSAADVTQTICIQNPPQPAFTLPNTTLCLTSSLTPTDISVVDVGCSGTDTFIWTVTGPAPVNFGGGTSINSHQPQFIFTQSGIFQISLTIVAGNCSTTTAIQTVNVDAPPAVSLSPDIDVCGTNLALNFSPAPGPTQTTITGTAVPQANTFTWTVTGDPGFSFIGGTTANSQYPEILFTDFATYTVTVTVQNSCGTVTKSQNITFQNAPTVTLTPSALNICPGSSVTLTGTITPPTGTTFHWIGSGVFSAPGSLITDYTPTAAEIAAHSATVKLDVLTGLSGSCSEIIQSVTINIYPVNTITSPPTKTLCTGSPLNYAITSTVPGSTYSWTAVLTSGSASGFTASGTGTPINDVLVDTDPVNNAVITYTIIPTANGCPGTPFILTVTVKPDPIITATPVATTICSGTAATINLESNVTGTTFTWTSTVITGSITGNHQQSTQTTNNVINDVLTNTGNLPATITYTVTSFNGTCQGNTVSTTITVEPLPVASNPGPNNEICAATTYTLAGNTPPAGAGIWTVSPSTGITFSDDTQPNAVASGLVPGMTYIFTWTITIPGCQSSSNSVVIKDDPAAVGGTTASDATVCSGSNSGTITLTGQVGTIVRWEQSTDGGTTWQPIANVNTTLTYSNLTTTTEYRVLVGSGVCAFVYSTVTTITVNTPAVQAHAGPNDEVCNTTAYTLQGNSAAPFAGKWTIVSGPAGAVFADDTQPNTTVTGLIPGNTYVFNWSITPLAPCTLNSSSVTIKDDVAPVGGTTSGAATVCAGSNSGTITLTGQVGSIVRWEQSTDGGTTWTPIANTSTTLQYLGLGSTTEYRVVVQNGVCPAVISTPTIITVNPPAVIANAGPNDEVCNSTVYTLQGNNPLTNAGKWTLTSGQPGVAFTDDTQFNTTVTGLIPGNTYQFTWTITALAPCTPSSASVTIKVDPATVGGTTTGNAIVCGDSNSGTVILSGQVGSVIRWEQSTDNGATWQPIANTSATLQYLNLTVTTKFRAVVQSNVCPVQISTPTTITVNPPTVQANAGSNQNLCGAVSTTLIANNPGASTGSWAQTAGPAATIVTPNSFQTNINGLIPGSTYTFVWTIKGLAPCADSSSPVQVFTAPDITPSFTADKTSGCGPYSVNFTNTSTSLTGVQFLWDFGDGSPQSNAINPTHTFLPATNGKDTTYIVSLSIVNNCFQRPPYTVKVTVSPANPVASILPLNLTGCSPFTLSVKNTSPGTNVSYVFYLYDGATLIQTITKTDKSNAVFNPITTTITKTYTVYMVATGPCGTTTETPHIPIVISPSSVTAQMFVLGGVDQGCVPFSVTFVNNTSGGSNFFYTIYDTNGQVITTIVAGLGNMAYTFTKIGTYFVTVTGSDNCSINESPKARIDVYPVPLPQFNADVKAGCDHFTATFTNLTQDDPEAPSVSLNYVWDFGDGTTATGFTPPPHFYNHNRSTYTVTLTATNPATGCSNVVIKQGFITVTSPPATAFTVKPDSVILIPDYSFSFVDQSTGSPATWTWTFGDGGNSTKQSPNHTYADTGLYKVTLTTTNSFGCDSTISHNVRITGTPGQLFLPNAFEPDGLSTPLRTFMAKGSGIKEWHMQVFNNYAQLIWETTRLSEKGEPIDGWDGTIKGMPAPQGVYVWQVSAKFIDGEDWKGNVIKNSLPKRVGVIHLIR